jgi:hypothetical protein
VIAAAAEEGGEEGEEEEELDPALAALMSDLGFGGAQQFMVEEEGDEEEEECLAARRARLADRGIDEQKLFEVRLPKKRVMKRCWLGIVVANLDFRGICGGRRGEGGPGGGLSARGLASR